MAYRVDGGCFVARSTHKLEFRKSRDAGPKNGGVVLAGIRLSVAEAKVLVMLGQSGEPRT